MLEFVINAMADVITNGNAERYLSFIAELLPDATVEQRMDRCLFDSFRHAALHAAQASSEAGSPVWVYSFNVPTQHALGTTHASDMPFIFNLFQDNIKVGVFHDGLDTKIRNLAQVWSDSFAAFMRTADPNGTGLPEWPVYDTQTYSCMVLEESARVVENPDGERILNVYGLS